MNGAFHFDQRLAGTAKETNRQFAAASGALQNRRLRPCAAGADRSQRIGVFRNMDRFLSATLREGVH